MREWFELITSNYILNVALASWFVAQLLKTILFFVFEREWNWERFVGSGGMPSSHTAIVVGMVIATHKSLGFASPVFAVTVVLAVIVMYDAVGVRRQAGEHARILNLIIESLESANPKFVVSKELKELLGHTPLEVLGGIIVGVLVALLIRP